MGEPFAQWVGDPDKWSDRFWAVYNLLKHDVNATYDIREVNVLAESAGVLLTCALLNSVVETDAPAKAICGSHKNYNLGFAVRELFGFTKPDDGPE